MQEIKPSWKLFALFNIFKLQNNGALLLLMLYGMHTSYTIFTIIFDENISSDQYIISNLYGWYIGLIIGYVIASKLLLICDHRSTQISSTVLFGFSAFLMLISNDCPTALLVAKITAGVGGAFVHTSYVHHSGETSPASTRGFVISRSCYYMTLGAFLYNSINFYWNFGFRPNFILANCTLALSILSWLFIYINTEESPMAFIHKSDKEAGISSCSLNLRHFTEPLELSKLDILANFTDLEDYVKAKNSPVHLTLQKFLAVFLIKVVEIISYNIFLNQILITSTFRQFPKGAIIPIIFSIQLLANMIFSLSVDKYGRKKILTISSLIVAVLFLVSGTLHWFHEFNKILSLSLISIYFFSACGIRPNGDILMSEIFEYKLKYAAFPIICSFEAIIQILLNFCSLSGDGELLYYYILFSNAIILIFIIVIVNLLLPETKGLKLKDCLTAFHEY